ncbi:MAG: hypothetical protein IJS90_09265, partial [Clostridia bacterium]|nr:hypothetical protein [Clostridia bacterium]
GRDVVYGLKIETSAARSVCYPYISERVSDVEILRNRMEKGSVCEEHIEDIVKDYITELYIKKLCINGLG